MFYAVFTHLFIYVYPIKPNIYDLVLVSFIFYDNQILKSLNCLNFILKF